MKKAMSFGISGIALALMVGMGATLLGEQTTTGPAVKPTAVTKKAATAPPAAGSKTTTTAGANKTKVSTANAPADTDSYWVEKLDVDGDGDVEDTNLVWDDEDKVLFASSTGAIGCKNGGTATGDLLVAVYGTGNTVNRPAGSGFWVADLDKGECGVQAAAMWGCKFDASGSDTACGIAVLDEKTDDLIIVAAAK
jgi:hypothetical protein